MGEYTKIVNHYHAGERPSLFVNVPPLPSHELIGRDELLADLVQRLLAGRSSALSTAGMPGVGKTALALALAYHPEVQAHFRDGILWAGLGTQPDVAGIQASWAEQLEIPNFAAITDPHQRAEAIGSAIGRRRMLAVLDDAWTLEPAQLLRPGGGVTCLLTTRDEGLARGFAPGQALHVPELKEDPSLALLRQLAPEACAVDPQAASELARATGGLPLTLELLGGYLTLPEHSLFPDLSQQAFAELADPRRRLALAQARLGGPLGQKQTLAATLALSVEQLEKAHLEAASAFATLGAFAPKPARFDRAAAAAVTGAGAGVLALLVGRNLMEADADGSLAMHQALADFAASRATEDARVRHREHYLALVEADEEDWQTIEVIYPQFLHAWRRQVETAADDRAVVRLASAVMTYQDRRGLRRDQMRCLETALACVQKQGDDRETANFFVHLGGVYSALGEQQKALTFYEQALPVYERLGDVRARAVTLGQIADVLQARGQLDEALRILQDEALPAFERLGDVRARAVTMGQIADVLQARGQLDGALRIRQEEQLPVYERLGDVRALLVARANIALILIERNAPGDRTEAIRLLNLALEAARTMRLPEAGQIEGILARAAAPARAVARVIRRRNRK